MLSERTQRLYQQHPPGPGPEGPVATLPELLHEIEVAAKFGISRDELALQLDIHPELFDSLLDDADIQLS
jgi:hypothetical protein